MNEEEFSPAGYAALLGRLRDAGYTARRYEDAAPGRRDLILRHDVDFSLGAALAMAEQEASLGLGAAYFVLLRTEFYNPLSGEGRAALRRLAALGHAVGLHVDGALYPEGGLDAAVAGEADLLAAALGAPVGLVSFHRPGANGIPAAERIGGRLNAYAPRFYGPDRYCSDSRGGWHHGHPLQHAAIRAGRALQLLIHPFWWQAPALPPEERLRRFLAERSDFLDRELARHCSVHRPAR
ncbi:MAG: hypothetical protein KIT16_07090 [Rhodospirillaceae bacterium]|nr:hypothetical protein [Rhodospirillaceae bacterium]